MKFLFQIGVLVLMSFAPVSLGVYTEETPCSRFDFDHKLLESLVRLEQSHAALRQELEGLKTVSNEDKESAGGNYVRWGRTECQENATATYKGYAGGSLFSHSGAASNYLCLPEDPEWTTNAETYTSEGARVYGAEFESTGGTENFFDDVIHNNDVPCVVCDIERANILMLPGRISCYEGWHLEYSGFLAAGHTDHIAASEYVCLDDSPEVVAGGSANENGKLFYLADARCGSLPCPPYKDRGIMSCVVCSK